MCKHICNNGNIMCEHITYVNKMHNFVFIIPCMLLNFELIQINHGPKQWCLHLLRIILHHDQCPKLIKKYIEHWHHIENHNFGDKIIRMQMQMQVQMQMQMHMHMHMHLHLHLYLHLHLHSDNFITKVMIFNMMPMFYIFLD